MLTTYHHPVPLSRNLGTLISWNTLGLSKPVTGLIYVLGVHIPYINPLMYECRRTVLHKIRAFPRNMYKKTYIRF